MLPLPDPFDLHSHHVTGSLYHSAHMQAARQARGIYALSAGKLPGLHTAGSDCLADAVWPAQHKQGPYRTHSYSQAFQWCCQCACRAACWC